ncbi:MAG TPA: TMEM175 family protein [Acidimicrobiales bacterium]|nr:TMEM175 family protein [Acidimicrobiales bacterium]
MVHGDGGDVPAATTVTAWPGGPGGGRMGGGGGVPAGRQRRGANRDDLPGVERLLGLSDGVVAIALTLLVLQLTVPSLSHAKAATPGALATKLSNGSDEFVSYIISFYVIAQFWLAHHRVFRHVAGHSEGLAWWNFAFLFTITIMPFSSNLLGDYASNPLAVDIFAVNLLLASLATQAVGIFGARRGLLVAGTPEEAMRAGRDRALAVVVAVSVSVGLAWVNTTVAKYCWILIAVLPPVAGRWARYRERSQPPPAGQPGAG